MIIIVVIVIVIIVTVIPTITIVIIVVIIIIIIATIIIIRPLSFKVSRYIPYLKGYIGLSGSSCQGLMKPPWLPSKRTTWLQLAAGNVGALIIRIGFWGFLIIIIVYYTPIPLLLIKVPILGGTSHKDPESPIPLK